MASAIGIGAAEPAFPSSPSAEPWDLQTPRAMPCWCPLASPSSTGTCSCCVPDPSRCPRAPPGEVWGCLQTLMLWVCLEAALPAGS